MFEVIDAPLVSSRSKFEEEKMRKKTEKEKYKNYDDKNENDNKTSKHIENIKWIETGISVFFSFGALIQKSYMQTQ